MQVTVHFYSYFKDLAGCPSVPLDLPEKATIEELLRSLFKLHPKLEPMKKSMLIAVGVDYQRSDYELMAGDDVSLFPPVQGG
jgi:molybdopterin converting factor small subunit